MQPPSHEEWMDEDPGECGVCGVKRELVRPGKTQDACDCWTICPQHGRGAIQYHREGVVPGVSGYFCRLCWEQ